MSEFNIRAEGIDVEQLMEQIRARIREKRGADYTEQQIRELAAVKLDRFLDPANIRSDLLDHYRRRAEAAPSAAADPAPPLPRFEFDNDTIYRSSRGVVGRALYGIRRLLRPVLKLFFNPTPITHALHTQQQINEYFAWSANRTEEIAAKLKARAELDALTYELLNNLVVEMTRLSVDVKNHKMRVESVAGRLDFDERRARALEDVVEYRTRIAPPDDGGADAEGDDAAGADRRKRRRRRGRRRSGSRASGPDAAPEAASAGDAEAAPTGDAGAVPAGDTDAAEAARAGDAEAGLESAPAGDTARAAEVASAGDAEAAPAGDTEAAPDATPAGDAEATPEAASGGDGEAAPGAVPATPAGDAGAAPAADTEVPRGNAPGDAVETRAGAGGAQDDAPGGHDPTAR